MQVQPSHGLAAVGDNHVFAGLCSLDELRESVLGFQVVYLHDFGSTTSWPQIAMPGQVCNDDLDGQTSRRATC